MKRTEYHRNYYRRNRKKMLAARKASYRRNRKRILAGMKRRYMEKALKLVRLERSAA